MKRRTRRNFVGASAVLVTTIAGCGGDSGTGGETPTTATTVADATTSQPTDTETTTTTAEDTTTLPTSLSLENAQFCSSQPDGYGQCSPLSDGTYSPGDVVWLYVEPSTVGTESAADGELRFSFDMSETVYTPDGTEIDTITDTVSRTVADSSDLSTVFLAMSFSPPTEFEPGTHRLELTVTDEIADTEASTTMEFEVEPAFQRTGDQLTIPEIVFTDGEASDYDDFTRKEDGEYGPTERVWYYYEIDGIAFEETDDELRTDISIFETLTGPEGDTWAENDIPLSNEFSTDFDLSTFYVTDYLSPAEQWIEGEYTITFEVTDGYTDETIEQTGTFTVVE